MKVITEERLRELIETNPYGGVLFSRMMEILLRDSLEKIDTLTVSKLRLIIDLDIGREVLIYCQDESGVYFFGVLRLMEDAFLYSDEGMPYDIESMNAVGWLPIPIYKPE